DCIHDLAEDILVGDLVGFLPVPRALDDLAAEEGYLLGSGGEEVVVKFVARFELLRVDEEGTRLSEGGAVLGEVAEERQSPVLETFASVGIGPLKAGYIVEDELR